MSATVITSEDAPLDCTSSTATVLDLCVRHQRQSPHPEISHQAINNNNNNISKLFTTDSDSSEDGLLNAMYTTAVASVWLNRDTPTSGSRPTRPFKAYMPKDPFLLGMESTPGVDSSSTTADTYTEFRRRMLEHVRAANPPPGVTNTKMRRNMVSSANGAVSTTAHDKDASYWEKRKKNNEAAKRSRDARRAKEDEIAIRAAFLEQENLKLKYEIATLRNETARLRCLLYN